MIGGSVIKALRVGIGLTVLAFPLGWLRFSGGISTEVMPIWLQLLRIFLIVFATNFVGYLFFDWIEEVLKKRKQK